MKIFTVKKSVLWAMALMLAGGTSLCAPDGKAESSRQPDSAEITKLLKEARSQAVHLQIETDRLESYQNAGLSRESHARQLMVTKEHVNDLGKTLAKLEARKVEASSWQRKAIDQMRPLLEQLADRTTRAIAHVNEKPRQMRDPDYHELLADKSDLSVQLKDLLNDHVDYGEARADLEEAAARVGPLP